MFKKLIYSFILLITLTTLIICYPLIKGHYKANSYSPIQLSEFCATKHQQPTIIFLGDSLTQGTMSFDYVSKIAALYPSINFINFGKNAQLSAQISPQIDPLLDCHISEVIILIGDNDIFYHSFPAYASFYDQHWKLKKNQSQKTFLTHIDQIAFKLKQHSIKTTFVSPALIAGSDKFKDAQQYIDAIKATSTKYGSHYIALNEAITQKYVLNPYLNATCTYDIQYSNFLKNNYLSLYRKYWLDEHWDIIAKSRHLTYTHDCVHLDEKGGQILVSLLTEHLDKTKAKN